MLDRLINGLIYISTVVIVFGVTGLLVKLIAQPLVSLSYVQAVSATLLVFIFFQIGSISFETGDDE